MTIERDEHIKFHELGTLTAVTRWVSTHDEGIAEWLKNARRAYQADRAGVIDEDRAALLLFKDGSDREPARIGLLDVGGATIEDVTAWSTWQDPYASRRQNEISEEDTQGNGGKAYMFRMFRGTARILGIREGKRNCKGFEGTQFDVTRGTPGFIPDAANGREVTIASLKVELNGALQPYGIDIDDLPAPIRSAIEHRQAFTLVEGVDPCDLYRHQILSDDLMNRVLRHEQSTLAIQQLRLYAMHSRRLLNSGRPFDLPPIDPFPGLEGPFIYPIPEKLELPDGGQVSTTNGADLTEGRLLLHTSKENMPRVYKNLKPRWRISYKTSVLDMIGSKPISDFAHTTPGAQYIYGTVELPALAPGYVEHGRRRPKPGPLVDALDQFVSERIKEIAKRISEQKKQALDDKALDEVQIENQKLDQFKNKFIATDFGDSGESDGGPGGPNIRTREVDYGTVPEAITLSPPSGGLKIGCGVEAHARQLLQARILDATGKPVRASLTWHSSDQTTARFASGDLLAGRTKGATEIWASVKHGRQIIESERVHVQVVLVDHVLLTPRKLEIPLGRRESIIAEVTDDEGGRTVDVLLNWKHDADDPLTLLIGPKGSVTGNRVGRSTVSAGGLGTGGIEVWSRIPVEVEVVANPEQGNRGGGFPRLQLTDRDLDPATGQIRDGDPDSPALWQEASDFVNNIWWLNLQSPEARFAFNERETNRTLWRTFHSGVVMEMVVQVNMQTDYTRKGDSEQPDLWANHRNMQDLQRVITVQQMWRELEPYVQGAEELD